MKKIIFYSYLGNHVPNLAALAHFKPKNVKIIWFIQFPQKISAEPDGILSLEQLGFQIYFKSKLSSIRYRFYKQKIKHFIVPYTQTSLQKENIRIEVIDQPWWEEIAEEKPDGIILPTIVLPGNYPVIQLAKLAKRFPIFLHEYCQSIKDVSLFDLYKERYEYLSAIFLHGQAYLEQFKNRKIKTKYYMTGGSKTDFYSFPFLFNPPYTKPFLIYCNTVSNISIYNSRASQPETWVPILDEICSELNLKLIIKLHPLTYYQYLKSNWSSQVYFNSFTADLFRQAVGVISDPSTILLEALLAKKPLIITDNNIGLPKNLNPILKVIPTVKIRQSAIKNLLKSYLNSFRFTSSHQNLLNYWWHKPDGNASTRIWEKVSHF